VTRSNVVLSLGIHPFSGSIFSRFPHVKIPFVSVPRRDPETSYCEVRKSVRDSSGVLRPIEVVAVVIGVAKAKAAVEEFIRRLTEEEERAGISFIWEYTPRRKGRG